MIGDNTTRDEDDAVSRAASIGDTVAELIEIIERLDSELTVARAKVNDLEDELESLQDR